MKNSFRLDRLLLSLGQLDRKCKDGCWYCEESCHHCLKPASAGYSLRKTDGTILKFCKSNICSKFYSQDMTDVPVIIMPLPLPSTDSELLLQVAKVISTNWSENTVIIIQLCVAHTQNVHGFNDGQLYVLTQFRTLYYHKFFDFSISNKFVPLNALPYMKHKNSVIMQHSALLMLMIKLIVEDALHQTSYKTLERLLDFHHSTVQDQNDNLQTENLCKDTPGLTGMC